VLIGGGLIYILPLSLPFVPGVELGILLMCVFGKEGIVLAVSPVPILVCLGIIQLEAFLGV
jgi:hypothetical protein